MTHSTMLGEAATTTLLVVQSAVAAFMLAVIPADQLELMSWTLLPMIGATLAAGGAFCLNTQVEMRKVVIGRCLFAIVVGVVFPRLASMTHPWVTSLMADPILKVGAGFGFGLLGYVVSWFLVKRMYERAPVLAAQQVQALENIMVQKIRAGVALDAAVVAEGVAQVLAEHQAQPEEAAKLVVQAIAQVAEKLPVQISISQPPTNKP